MPHWKWHTLGLLCKMATSIKKQTIAFHDKTNDTNRKSAQESKTEVNSYKINANACGLRFVSLLLCRVALKWLTPVHQLAMPIKSQTAVILHVYCSKWISWALANSIYYNAKQRFFVLLLFSSYINTDHLVWTHHRCKNFKYIAERARMVRTVQRYAHSHNLCFLWWIAINFVFAQKPFAGKEQLQIGHSFRLFLSHSSVINYYAFCFSLEVKKRVVEWKGHRTVQKLHFIRSMYVVRFKFQLMILRLSST